MLLDEIHLNEVFAESHQIEHIKDRLKFEFASDVLNVPRHDNNVAKVVFSFSFCLLESLFGALEEVIDQEGLDSWALTEKLQCVDSLCFCPFKTRSLGIAVLLCDRLVNTHHLLVVNEIVEASGHLLLVEQLCRCFIKGASGALQDFHQSTSAKSFVQNLVLFVELPQSPSVLGCN